MKFLIAITSALLLTSCLKDEPQYSFNQYYQDCMKDAERYGLLDKDKAMGIYQCALIANNACRINGCNDDR